MSQVLLFTDLHAYLHKKRVERLEDCLKIIDWVFQTARDYNIKNIIFGGDLYHDRQKIDVYTYQRVFETLQNNINDEKLWLLLGNHDLWYNDNTSISSVIPLSALNNVEVIAEPKRIKIEGSNWDFIPFTHDPLTTMEELEKLPGKPEYAIGHIALDGAMLHNNSYSEVVIEHDGDMVKVDSKIFDKYKNVFLGHYHAAQKINKIVEYIGSPLQFNFGEAFQDKHIIVFDTQTQEKTYIKNDFSPKHFIISEDEIEKYDLKGQFVKILVNELGATDIVKMRQDIINNSSVSSLEIKTKTKKLDEHVIVDAKAILFKEEEMLVKYVDEVGTDNLDKDKLLEIGRKICSETKI